MKLKKYSNVIKVGLATSILSIPGYTGVMKAYGEPIKENEPNFLFILIDDLGWKDLGCMGSDYYETPNIDKFSKEGVLFTNAYAPAANCAPSRACIISGQNTPRHGIYTVANSDRGDARCRRLVPQPNNVTLPDENITFAEALKTKGYRTASIGKWHVGEDPCTQGIDVNIGGSHAGHPKSYISPYRNKNLPDGPKGEYLTDRLTREAMNFMESSKDQPFCLYLPYYTVHTPLQGKKELIEKYKRKGGKPGQDNASYAAMVECADANIGLLLKKLDQLGLRENTFVVLFSDNGGLAGISSQQPLRAGKGSYYEGGIREPLIIRWPKKIKGGWVSDEPVSGLDFYPTFLDVANMEKPASKVLDGESLLPLLTHKKHLKREALYWHFPIYLQGVNPLRDQARDPLFRTRPGSVIRMGDWKLHEYFEDGTLELYNLKKDEGETNNVAKTYPGKTKKLLKKLRSWRNNIKAPVPSELNPKFDSEFEKKARQSRLKKFESKIHGK